MAPRRRAVLPPKYRARTTSFAHFEFSRINFRVDSVLVEDRFFRRRRANRSPDAERQFQAIDVAVIGVIDSVLRRFCRGYRLFPRCNGVLFEIYLLFGFS